MKKIFREYFLRNIVIWGAIGLIALLIRFLIKPETSVLFGAGIVLSFVVVGVAFGYSSYRFHEKSAPRIISELLEKTPLSDFQAIHFLKEDENRIGGFINNYKVFLAPVTSNGEKSLIVLIPLQMREGLQNYFVNFDNHFKFKLSDNVLFAEAILKNYDRVYNFQKLVALLESTTSNLRDRHIMPVAVASE